MKISILFFLLFFALSESLGQTVFISEIFADPTPSKGLPEREFIEIYNAGTKEIKLKGFKLKYGNTVTSFPDSSIKPQSFAIVCRANYRSEFQPYGHVIAVSSLSLNNSGNTLVFYNQDGDELHYIPYSPGWYAPERKQGYSLEMIDDGFPCVGKNNWTSSLAEMGATPGKANSVKKKNPDTENPKLLGTDFDAFTAILFFDEIIAKTATGKLENLVVSNGDNEVDSLYFPDGQRDALAVVFKKEIENGLEFLIYKLPDCSGNTAYDINISYLNLPEPNFGDIQISEVLFNPPIAGEDYVEIFNNSNQAFNLKNWLLARINSQGEISDFVTISTQDKVLEAASFLAFSTNKNFLETNYPNFGHISELTKLPPYNNDEGTVYLLKPDSTVFDSFSYSEEMHSYLINNPKGVSLEKVSFRNGQNQWLSAASDVNYGTPGTQNSQQENELLNQEFITNPVVFNPFQSSTKPSTNLEYKLNNGGYYANIYILDKHGRRVKTIGENLLLGTEGHFEWDGRNDSNTLLPVGYYAFIINVFAPNINETYYAKTVIGSY